VSQERRYESIVRELRKRAEVDYVFMDSKLEVENRNYHIPKVLSRHVGYRFLASVMVHYLIVRNRYHFCISDYRSAFRPIFATMIRKFAKMANTKFIYDVRTVPVEYPDYRSKLVERQFARQLRFVNRFYEGITLITGEMRKYIEQNYASIHKPSCIWESGVDTSIFKPMPKNRILGSKLGFKDSDFLCFYHGSLSEKRGVIELVESFAIQKLRDESIKLLILGVGEGFGKVQRMIDDLSLGDSVRIRPRVEHCKVAEYISLADLCIVPLPDIDWWRVSSPLKLMEYIACGKVILMTDMIAHRNVVGENSLYFWIDNVTPELLAEKILEVFRCFSTNGAEFYERGMKEREKLISHISWEKRSEALEKFLLKLSDCV
jgi:glycosyltransferase involved in cell wall biosynthesis